MVPLVGTEAGASVGASVGTTDKDGIDDGAAEGHSRSTIDSAFKSMRSSESMSLKDEMNIFASSFMWLKSSFIILLCDLVAVNNNPTSFFEFDVYNLEIAK